MKAPVQPTMMKVRIRATKRELKLVKKRELHKTF